MRRTRHITLPVRSWQYMGLLIVSLACLTLGLVSRDREGRAGSLAGPELEHTAPHEVDACPNSTPFTKVPAPFDDETRTLKTQETRVSRNSPAPNDLRISRSRLESASRSRQSDLERRASRMEFRSAERLARQGQATFRIQDRVSARTARLSRSLDPADVRLTRTERRSTERREPIRVDRRENREIARGIDRERISRNDRVDFRDRRSRSTERRESMSRQIRASDNRLSLDRESSGRRVYQSRSMDRRQERMDRDTFDRRSIGPREIPARSTLRFEIRERRSRSTERRELNNAERRLNERQDSRENRRERENLASRIPSERRATSVESRRLADDRRSRVISRKQEIYRNSRSSREENRQAPDLEARRSRYQSRVQTDRFTHRSPTRTMENSRRLATRSNSERRINASERRESRSMDREGQRVDLNDRRVFKRSAEQRREINRVPNRASRERESLVRSMDRVSADSRRERNDLQRNIDRSRRVQTIRRTSRSDLDRRSLTRLERRESANERRERVNLERSERRESIRSLERREINFERERINREARMSRAARISKRDSERRVRNLSDGRNTERLGINSRRSSERRAVESREELRTNRRHLEQRLDRRMYREELRTNRRNLEQRLDRRMDRRVEQRFSSDRSRARENEFRAEKERRMVGRAMSEPRRSRSLDLALRSDRDSRNHHRRSVDIHARDTVERNFLRKVRTARISTDTRENRNTENLPRIAGILLTRERIARAIRNKDIGSRTRAAGVSNFLKGETSMEYNVAFDVLRQALVIGLCTVYCLSLISGKGSFIGNTMRRAPRFIVW